MELLFQVQFKSSGHSETLRAIKLEGDWIGRVVVQAVFLAVTKNTKSDGIQFEDIDVGLASSVR